MNGWFFWWEQNIHNSHHHTVQVFWRVHKSWKIHPNNVVCRHLAMVINCVLYTSFSLGVWSWLFNLPPPPYAPEIRPHWFPLISPYFLGGGYVRRGVGWPAMIWSFIFSADFGCAVFFWRVKPWSFDRGKGYVCWSKETTSLQKNTGNMFWKNVPLTHHRNKWITSILSDASHLTKRITRILFQISPIGGFNDSWGRQL